MRDLIDCFPEVVWQEDRGRKTHDGIPGPNAWSCTRRLGVVGAITPWNVPLYVNIGKVVCGLLAGCTQILKPAPDTPLMGSFMGELGHRGRFSCRRAQCHHRERPRHGG